MDTATKQHLGIWLRCEFADDVIEHHNMVERITSVFESDPEWYGNRSWWDAFDAAGIDRSADIPSLEPLFGGEQQ